MSATDSAFMGLSYLYSGNPEIARSILDDVKKRENHLSKYIAVKLCEISGDFSHALMLQKEITDELDDLNTEITHRDVTDLIAQYYTNIVNSKYSENKALRSRYIIIIIASTIIFILLALFLYYLARSNRLRMNEKIRFIEDLQAVCNANEENISQLQKSVQELMKERFDSFNRLHLIMSENSNGNISPKRFSEVVNEVLYSIAPGGKDFQRLETWVDSHHNNIMSNLKIDLPNLKDCDYALFLYVIIGFSIPSIANILGVENITSIYNRKRRLKNKILSLQCGKKEAYLSFFS